MEKMFETAVRTKMRFPYRGLISVEDLWDLGVNALDSVFKALNAEKKRAEEESLLVTKNKEDEVLETKIAIVRYIVSVKLEEKAAREKAVADKEKKQKIMQIIAEKKDEVLKNASIEELEKMLEN